MDSINNNNPQTPAVRPTALDGIADQLEAERTEIDKQTLDNAMKKYIHQQRFQQAMAWTQ